MSRKMKTSAILLAGGIGSRMQSSIPKQFLELNNKQIALYSFELFHAIKEIDEIVVVCSPDFRPFFKTLSSKQVVFAIQGGRRQDSVFNGLQASSNELICIHDSARPFIDQHLVLKVLKVGQQYGAAALGMPIKFTVKEADSENFVTHTPDRAKIWEIQTPQVLHRDILIEGFEFAYQQGITVTDDVSLAELIGKQVKLVEGSHTNLKISVPADLSFANHLTQSVKQ